MRLGDIAEVRFGIKTGADSFFYVSEATAAELGIEAEFLRRILVSSDQTPGYTTRTADTDVFLVTTNRPKSDLIGTRMLAYITRGETEAFAARGRRSIPATRPSCRSRRPYWYSIKTPLVPPIYWAELRWERYSTLLNQASLHSDHTFYGVYPHTTPDATTSVCALLNCTLMPLWVEMIANNLGAGSLQTPIYEIKRCVWIPHRLIGSQEVSDAFAVMCRRECIPILKELSLPDRQALDQIVFDAIGLTPMEREGVYEAVVDLIEKRVHRADSVR